MNPLLLYIHPNGHLNDLVVPAGALTCLNAVSVPRLGRYAFEVSDDEILAATCICMDVHWALSLSGFERLIAHVRSVRADVPVVVGGVSAGHYARELLDRYPVDYVLQGDSEKAFARLIGHVFAGTEPGEIPNVHRRGHPPPPLERMSPEEFDATDCLTADWFPTYERHSNWDAVAFPQGRTLTASRGCAFRCPECYGSYANTFGRGYLMRSPERLAETLHEAARMGTRNLRLFLAKPSAKKLSAAIRGIADAGPYHFDSAVGFYLCMPPTVEDLGRLEAAFSCRVDISLIPPDEHVPALAPVQLDKERALWRLAADRIADSPNLFLDVWTTGEGALESVRSTMIERDSEHVKVSSGAVWSVTRPTDAGDKGDFDDVLAAMKPVWTFYAGRVLSPSIARVLQPFRFLDEIDNGLEELPPPEAWLAGYHELVMANWSAHHLPYLPGLAFSAWPVHTRAKLPPRRNPRGVTLRGAATLIDSRALMGGPAALAPEPTRLSDESDHRGVTLVAELPAVPPANALALVPHPVPDAPVTSAWFEHLLGDGLVALRLPSGTRAAQLRVNIRIQEADIAVLDESRELIARGKADLGYFRPRSGDKRILPRHRRQGG